MENIKEVKKIADHQEQHPVVAPPPQGSPPADNPLQPPELQRVQMEGKGEERKANSEMNQACGGKPKECCCCLRGLQTDSVIQWCADECCYCCFTPCLFICVCLAGVVWFCCSGCSDSLYK